MFDYKQRPFAKHITDEEYDRATGRMTDEEKQECRLDQLDEADKPSPTPLTTLSGHTCNGTYKTFAAVYCPYCTPEGPLL